MVPACRCRGPITLACPNFVRHLHDRPDVAVRRRPELVAQRPKWRPAGRSTGRAFRRLAQTPPGLPVRRAARRPAPAGRHGALRPRTRRPVTRHECAAGPGSAAAVRSESGRSGAVWTRSGRAAVARARIGRAVVLRARRDWTIAARPGPERPVALRSRPGCTAAVRSRPGCTAAVRPGPGCAAAVRSEPGCAAAVRAGRDRAGAVRAAGAGAALPAGRHAAAVRTGRDERGAVRWPAPRRPGLRAGPGSARLPGRIAPGWTA